MTDPGLAIQAAMTAAIIAKLTARGYTSPSSRVVIDPEPGLTPLPHVVVGDDSATSFPTKTSEGAEVMHTFVCWARKYRAALKLTNEVLQALTDRDSMLAVTGFTTVRADLDFRSPMIRKVAPGEDEGTIYGLPVRLRYVVVAD